MTTAIKLIPAVAAFFLISPVNAGAQAARPWSQGDPTPQEQQAMEWLNAARKDPAATLTQLLSLAGSDSVISGFMLQESPTTAAQLEQWIQANDLTALADSAAYPGSEAISGAPLVFYPLFQQ